MTDDDNDKPDIGTARTGLIPLEGVGTSGSEAIRKASQGTKLGRIAPLPDAHLRTISVSSDSDTKTVDVPGDRGRTLLHEAAAKGDGWLVDYLVNKLNADVLPKDDDGKTPRDLARSSGHHGITAILRKAEQERTAAAHVPEPNDSHAEEATARGRSRRDAPRTGWDLD